MSLTKEIKENKWGIILGGVWGLLTGLIACIAGEVAGINIAYIEKDALCLFMHLIIAPYTISFYIVYYSHLLQNLPFFWRTFFLSSFIGMFLGYLMSNLIKKVIRK